MTSGFQTASALRAARPTGLPSDAGRQCTSLPRGDERQPYLVLDEIELFERGDEFGPEDLILTIDPFVSESWTG